MQYSTIIGVDVHARSNTAYALDTLTGAVAQKRLPADAGALVRWIDENAFSAPVCCCYESGPTGFALARELHAQGVGCAVAAVSRLPKASDGKKSDPIDAERLCRLFMSGAVTEVWLPPAAQEAHRSLSRLRAQASKDAARAKQRATSFLLAKGMSCEHENWTAGWRAWAKGAGFCYPEERWALDEYLAEAARLEARVRDIDARIAAFKAEHGEYGGVIARLEAINGIGPVTAFALAVEVGDFSRFRTAAQFASYLGLVPSEHSSGERRHTGHITKCGNPYLRRLLIECASPCTRARRMAPAAGTGLPPLVKGHIERCNRRLKARRAALDARGKQANKAKCAIAREMAEWIYHIATM
jgi:transposase